MVLFNNYKGEVEMGQDTLNLGEILKMILRHIKLIVLTTIVSAAIFFSYAYFFVVPTYVSSGIIQIQNTDNYISSANTAKEGDTKIYVSDIQASADLAKNCVLLFSIDTGMRETLNGASLSIEQVNESQFLRVSVVSSNNETLQALTDDVLHKSSEIFKTTFNGAGRADIKSSASVAVPTNKNAVLKTTFIGILIGLIIGAIIAVIREFMDSTIKPDDDLYERYKVNVLAEILDFDTVTKKGKSGRGGR